MAASSVYFGVRLCGKIITTNFFYGPRHCLEAWHINMSHHFFNQDEGIDDKTLVILLADDVMLLK